MIMIFRGRITGGKMQHKRRKTVRSLGAAGFFFPLASHLQVGARPQSYFLSHAASDNWKTSSSGNLHITTAFPCNLWQFWQLLHPAFPPHMGPGKTVNWALVSNKVIKVWVFLPLSKMPKTLNFSLEAPEVKVMGKDEEIQNEKVAHANKHGCAFTSSIEQQGR